MENIKIVNNVNTATNSIFFVFFNTFTINLDRWLLRLNISKRIIEYNSLYLNATADKVI